jgi:transposase
MAMEGLTMLTITNTTITRDEVWRAFRRTPDVRLRERYHCVLVVMDGKTCPEIAPWLYRDEETIRSWVQAFNTAGLHGLERAPIPGRPT